MFKLILRACDVLQAGDRIAISSPESAPFAFFPLSLSLVYLLAAAADCFLLFLAACTFAGSETGVIQLRHFFNNVLRAPSFAQATGSKSNPPLA
jgi:hypothetical protein